MRNLRPVNVPAHLLPLASAVMSLAELWQGLRIDEPTVIDEAVGDVLEAFHDSITWEVQR